MALRLQWRMVYCTRFRTLRGHSCPARWRRWVSLKSRWTILADGVLKGGDRYSRFSARVIINLPQVVIKSVHERVSEDRLAQKESTPRFQYFLCSKGISAEDCARCFQRLGKTALASQSREETEVVVDATGSLHAEDLLPETDAQQEEEVDPSAPKPDKSSKSESVWTMVREAGRSTLLCLRLWQTWSRILHCLGSDCRAPGLDDFRYEYTGRHVPSSSNTTVFAASFSTEGAGRVHDSSVAETSHSTSGDGQ